VCPESSNCGEIAALIREKAHWPGLWRSERQDTFVSDGIGGVLQRCPDVVRGQSGIRVQKILDLRTLSQLAEQKFNGYPSPANYGLTLHDAGIDLDAIGHF
jgi:hypothetical protein